jgi:hypothetical protein
MCAYNTREASTRSGNLTPLGGLVVGGVFAAFGLIPILAGLRVIPMRMSPGIPPWLVVAVGSMFVTVGFSLINGYGLGGVFRKTATSLGSRRVHFGLRAPFLELDVVRRSPVVGGE